MSDTSNRSGSKLSRRKFLLGSAATAASAAVTVNSERANAFFNTFGFMKKPAGSGQTSNGYVIGQSLRFNGSSTYLSRTPTAAGDQKTATVSYWYKPSNFNGDILHVGTGSPVTQTFIRHSSTAAGTLYIANYAAGTQNVNVETKALFRDPSAWYHIVVTFDFLNSTQTDRVRLYVNGNRVTDFYTPTYPSTTDTLSLNNSVAHCIGARGWNNDQYISGYLAEAHFIDGYALDATYFGQTDSQTGQWIPKIYSASPVPAYSSDIVPTMTSATSPSGSVTASSEPLPADRGWAAFDDSGPTTYWNCNAASGWLTYDFGTTKTVTRYSIMPLTGFIARAPKDWILEGWNGSWQTIDTRANITTWTGNQRHYFNVASPGAYSKYRFSFSSNNGDGSWTTICEMEYFETTGTTSYGTNGCYLKFADASDVTAATMGKDSSGNSNNWTPTNFQTHDQVLDSPTNNFCTWNPAAKTTFGTWALSSGNLRMACNYAAGYWPIALSTFPLSSQKFYYEVTLNDTSSDIYRGYGVSSLANIPVSDNGTPQIGGTSFDPNGLTWIGDGRVFANGSLAITLTGVFSTWSQYDVRMFAVDPATGNIWLGKNGTWYNSGNPATGSSPTVTTSGRAFTPSVAIGGGATGTSQTVNFGQGGQTGHVYDAASGGRFKYTPPAGFKALCTVNLPSNMPVVTSGTFTGNANSDGPFVWLGGAPTDLTINGNTVTWGTHADKLASGFKVRTSSASYNASGSNSFSATVPAKFKWATARSNP